VSKIARSLFGSYDWPQSLTPPPGRRLRSTDDNPTIPSGYTYLLQLVAHDLVNTQTPFWEVQKGLGTANLQSNPLRLTVLYGGGPAACPVAFAAAGVDGQDRYKLRTGKFGVAQASEVTTHFSDLSRIVADGCTETLIADPRNTDNAVLSQLTVLFSLLHNTIADAITGNPKFSSIGPASLPYRAVFEQARSAVEQIYRRIVLEELLDKILHPAVLASYREQRKSVWDQSRVPLELTHAVLRFGHVMARDFYFLRPDKMRVKLSESLNFAGPAEAGSTAIPPLWLVQWSSFFEMNQNGISPNYSRRIGPGMSAELFDQLSFQPIGEEPPLGLPYRDAKSALLAGLWSVDALINEVREHAPDLLPADWVFTDPAARARAIAAWLSGKNQQRNLGLTGCQIDRIAADPPLWIFVLLEAALDPAIEGRHLGVLASIIFADVIFGIAATAMPDRASGLPAAEQQAIDAITTMEDCVRYVAAHVPVPAGGLPLI